jgi:hypothetical protein
MTFIKNNFEATQLNCRGNCNAMGGRCVKKGLLIEDFFPASKKDDPLLAAERDGQ